MPSLRIACFHLNQLGDLVFSLPALLALGRGFPKAQIISVARPPHRELLLLSGLVHNVVERPRGQLISKLKMVSALRSMKLDLAVLFSTSLGTAILAWMAHPREKAGFGKRGLAYRAEKIGPPSVANNLRLVEALGCRVEKRDYVGLVKLDESVRCRVRDLLMHAGIGESTPYAVISPAASGRRAIKEWTSEGFAAVAERLADDLDLVPVLVGTEADEVVAGLSEKIVDLRGKTSIIELAALLEGAHVFVGIDSGVMHLAAAVGTPVVALFGPTDPAITGPMGEGHKIVQSDVPCLACMKTSCREPLCMQRITPDAVIESVAMCVSEEKNV